MLRLLSRSLEDVCLARRTIAGGSCRSLSPVQGALEWLEKNQDKPLDEIQAEEANKGEQDDEEATEAKIAELETGQARSMVCNECGKKLRSVEAAEFHASKTCVLQFLEGVILLTVLVSTPTFRSQRRRSPR